MQFSKLKDADNAADMKYDDICIQQQEEIGMPRITFSTPEAMSHFINAQVETGKYDNVSEYLRDLIRHDQERKETAHAELRELLIKAEQSGISNSTLEATRKRVKERLISEGHKLQD